MIVSDIFDVRYGVNLELNACQIVSDNDPRGINFVSRTSVSNGVVAKVLPIEGVDPQPAGAISCAGGGSVLSTFVQTQPFYSGRDLYILTPKNKMTLEEKLFYCTCIHFNAFKYNYGRQANKTLPNIELPDSIPDWVYSKKVVPIKSNILPSTQHLSFKTWREFKIGQLFKIVKGKRLVSMDMVPGVVNYLGAISTNNGVRQKIDITPQHPGNCITVNYNGSVGEAFYQKYPFWASDDVNILYLKDYELNPFLGLFLVTIIKANKPRYSYGRKWQKEQMENDILLLPADTEGNPDWAFMTEYMKKLPFSDKIV